MRRPLVSVLTTSYNREKYIVETIESVLAQTFSDFEYIIVDNNSSDNSLKIANAYAKKDSRIQVYKNIENIGDYPNRNMAASYANGKYIKYVDSDDIIFPNCLEVLVNVMENNEEAAWGIFARGDEIKVIQPSEIWENHFTFGGIKWLHCSPLHVIMKREMFENIGKFSHEKYAGDFEMWLRVSSKHPLAIIPENLGWWREHDSQGMTEVRADLRNVSNYCMIAINFIKSQTIPLSDAYKNKIIYAEKSKIASHIIFAFLHLKFKVSKDIYKTSKLTLFFVIHCFFVKIFKKVTNF